MRMVLTSTMIYAVSKFRRKKTIWFVLQLLWVRDCWRWQERRRGKRTSGLVKREKRNPSENDDVARAVEW